MGGIEDRAARGCAANGTLTRALPPEIEIHVRSEDERREPLGKAKSATAHVFDSTPAPVARQMKERRIIGKRGGEDKDEG